MTTPTTLSPAPRWRGRDTAGRTAMLILTTIGFVATLAIVLAGPAQAKHGAPHGKGPTTDTTVERIPTVLTVNPAVAVPVPHLYGLATIRTMSAVLETADGDPLPGKRIALESCEGWTNALGLASCSYLMTPAWIIPETYASFAGDDLYEPSSGQWSLTHLWPPQPPPV